MGAPNYLTEAEYAERMKDFTGYIAYMNNQTKSDPRDEIAVVNTKVDVLCDKVDALIEDGRVLITLKLETYKMLQLVLDQLSTMRADRRRD